MATFDTISEADSDLLSAYIDNQLSSSEQAALEARLEREPVLRQTLNELQFTVAALRELEPMRPPRSFALDPASMHPQRSLWQLPATWMRFGSALAALLLAVTVTLDFSSGGAAGMSTAAQAPPNGESTGGGSTSAAASGMMAATTAPAAEAAPAAAAALATTPALEAPPVARESTSDQSSALATEATAAPADRVMSAAAATSVPAADTTANVPLAQSSGSSSPDTANIDKYENNDSEPQIVSSQPRSLLVLEIALGALALLLLAGSYWVARRKA